MRNSADIKKELEESFDKQAPGPKTVLSLLAPHKVHRWEEERINPGYTRLEDFSKNDLNTEITYI